MVEFRSKGVLPDQGACDFEREMQRKIIIFSFINHAQWDDEAEVGQDPMTEFSKIID